METRVEQQVELTDYRPGALGRMVEMLGDYYGEQWGWGAAYEIKVASDIAAFLRDFEKGRDLLLFARVDSRIAGCIAIDGREGKVGWLRWFIVEAHYRGLGIGARLLDQVLLHARTVGYSAIWLHTFSGLITARGLYESRGFRLVEESPGDEHGGATPMLIQTFIREMQP